MITSKYKIAGAVTAALLLASAPTLAEDIPNNYIENFTDGDLEGLTGYTNDVLKFYAETAPKPNPALAWNVDDNAGAYQHQSGTCQFVDSVHEGFMLAPQKDGADYPSNYAACSKKRGKDFHGIGRQVDNIVPGETYYLSGDGANKGSLRWAYSYSIVGASVDANGLAAVTTVSLTNIVVSDNAWKTVTDSFVAPDDIDFAQPFIVFVQTPPSAAYPKTGGINKDERAPMWVDNLSLMGPPQDGGGGDDGDSDGDGVPDVDDPFPNDPIDGADILEAIESIEDALALLDNGVLRVDATGTGTDVGPELDAFINQILAEAGITGVSINGIDGDALKSSGSHNLTIELINNAGSIISFNLVLNIIPTVSIPEMVVVRENEEITFNLDLSGAPLLYPVSFSYRFETMEEVPFIIDEAVLTIDEGETLSVVLPGQVIGFYQVVFFEGSERNAVISANSVTKINSQGNTAPAVDVALLNNGGVVTVLDQTADAAIAINITDIDMDTEHNVVATINNVEVFNAISDVTNPEIVVPVDADALATGSLDISVVVTEIETNELYSTSQTLKVSVYTELAQLFDDIDTDGDGDSDLVEGYGDDDGDGIANYLDDSTIEKHEQSIGTGDDAVTITVDEGLTLSIGELLKELESGLANSIGVEVATTDDYVLLVDVAVDDQGDVIDADIAASLVDVRSFLIPLIDYKITGANAGEAVNIIIPLPTALPVNSEYRKVQEDGSLVGFDTNNGNTIKSAISDAQGDCPAADSIDWQNGLILGNECVKLTIVDGGVNDADGGANGVIVDPAVIVEVNSAPTDVSASASTIDIVGGGFVELTANASDADNDDLTYSWVQKAGDTVTFFDDADKKVAMFVGPNATTTLTFEVTVSDGVYSNTASVNIDVSEVGEEKTGSGGSLGTGVLLFLACLFGLRIRRKRNL